MIARSNRRTSQHTRKLIRSFVLIVAVVIILVGFRLIEEIGPERAPGDRFTVVRVLDGDTVELLGGDKLRLLGVDTPERDEPLYHEARAFLENLVLGRAVRLEYGGARRDRYGRLLAFVWTDTLLVNRAILENGLGYLYVFDDSPVHSAEFRSMLDAQKSAIGAKVGLMGLAREPEPYYAAAQSSHRFHRPGCRSIANSSPERARRFATREEALAVGLSPCRNCRP